MEAINDSSRLVSQAIKILRQVNQEVDYDEKRIDEVITLLEESIEKLTKKI